MVGGVDSDLEQSRSGAQFPSGTLQRLHEEVTFELIPDEETEISR